MEIPLDLRRHCVETEIRRLYNRALTEAFRPGADREGLEERISLLQRALETLDFPALRSAHSALAGGEAAEAALEGFPEGPAEIRLRGRLLRGG